VLQGDNFWWEDTSCLVGQVECKTVAPICQHQGAATSTTSQPETTTTMFGCPGGWTEFEGHCYLLSDHWKNWQDAEQVCLSRGGHLASIHSLAEHDFLDGLVKTIAWVGGSDSEAEVKKNRKANQCPLQYFLSKMVNVF